MKIKDKLFIIIWTLIVVGIIANLLHIKPLELSSFNLIILSIALTLNML